MRLRFINILLCCLVLASCSDDTPELPVPVPEQPDLVKLTLRLPGFKTASRASVDDNAITSLQVLFSTVKANTFRKPVSTSRKSQAVAQPMR